MIGSNTIDVQNRETVVGAIFHDSIHNEQRKNEEESRDEYLNRILNKPIQRHVPDFASQSRYAWI